MSMDEDMRAAESATLAAAERYFDEPDMLPPELHESCVHRSVCDRLYEMHSFGQERCAWLDCGDCEEWED